MNIINMVNPKLIPALPIEMPAIRHGLLPEVHKKPVIVNFSHLLRWLLTNWPMHRMDVRRLEQYLFTIEMNEYNNKYVKKHLWNDWMRPPAACSEIWKNGIVGRNFDWFYDYTPTFAIRVPGNSKRYSSIGVATGRNLESDSIARGCWHDAFQMLPYLTMDGVNEKHVYAGLNVVILNGKEDQQWTGKELFGEEAIRWVLDNCATAQEAAEAIAAKAYMPKNFHNESFHFFVADLEHAFVIEDGIIHEETNRHPIMTNCRGTYDVFTDGKLDPLKLVEVDPYGAGVERFNSLLDQYAGIESVDDMLDVMRSIFYTKAYDKDNAWLSEVCAKYDVGDIHLDLTVDKTVTEPESFDPVFTIMKQMFDNRTREGADTWQTVHSSVYDLEKCELYLTVQEGNTVRKFSLDPFVYR